MREIKFRAWDKRSEIYLYNVQDAYDMLGGFVKYDNGEETYYDECCFGDFLDNKRYGIEQFAGLKDVNGKDIYEGDIMRAVPVRRQYPTAFSLKEHVGTLVIGSQRLTISGKTYDKELYDYEVIGNKFQNPELLEEQK